MLLLVKERENRFIQPPYLGLSRTLQSRSKGHGPGIVISNLTPLLLHFIHGNYKCHGGAIRDMMPLIAFMHARRHALGTMNRCLQNEPYASAGPSQMAESEQQDKMQTKRSRLLLPRAIENRILTWAQSVQYTVPQLDSCGWRRPSVSMQPLLDLDMLGSKLTTQSWTCQLVLSNCEASVFNIPKETMLHDPGSMSETCTATHTSWAHHLIAYGS